MIAENINELALEKATKYICTANCGKCPMIVEQFPCPQPCDLETVAWQCWRVYFKQKVKQHSSS